MSNTATLLNVWLPEDRPDAEMDLWSAARVVGPVSLKEQADYSHIVRWDGTVEMEEVRDAIHSLDFDLRILDDPWIVDYEARTITTLDLDTGEIIEVDGTIIDQRKECYALLVERQEALLAGDTAADEYFGALVSNEY